MEASINLKITGVRGGSPSYSENKGRVTTFVDNNDDFVAVDAFQGFDRTYKRRKECEIEICIAGKTWRGTKKELAEKLGLIKAKPLNKQQEVTKHFDAYLSGGQDLPYTKIYAAMKRALKENPDGRADLVEVTHKGKTETVDLIEDLEFTTVKRFCEMCGIE